MQRKNQSFAPRLRALDKQTIVPFHGGYLKTFERACCARSRTPEAVLETLGLKPAPFLQSLKSACGPNALQLKLVCDYFDITVESFLTGFIDVNWIANPRLPEKYYFSAGSKFRTSLPILDYVRKHQGPAFLNSILRTLKIPQSLLDQPDEKVSISLLSDLLKFLSLRGFTQDDFVRIGWHSVAISENAEIGKLYHGLSERQVFEKLFDEVIFKYEENFDYQIVRSAPNEIQVRVEARIARIEDFQSNCIDNLFVSHYRVGACAAQIKHAGFPIPATQLISSLHAGDDQEEFRAVW